MYLIKLVILLLLTVNCVSAKDLYVSTTGSDSTTYAANDIDNPWLTPAKAWYNAQAGDVVYFRGGTYYMSSSVDTNDPNGYDGTEANPITFQAYTGETVNFVATGGSGPMFQISKNWNVVKDINIDAGNYHGNVFAVGWYNGDSSVTGFVADNLHISNWSNGDNTNAFYIGSSYLEVTATNVTIQNCTLTGRTDADYQNYSAIQVFGATEFDIVGNDVSQVNRGIYIKHSSAGYTDHDDKIRNNYVHDMNSGYALRINGNYIDITNNIIVGTTQFGEDAEAGSNPNGTYLYFNHNTFVGQFEQLYDSGGGHHNTFTNNIFDGSVWLYAYTGNPEDPQIVDTNYNLYLTGLDIRHIGSYYSLSTWITHLVSDSTGGSQEANSIAGTPDFVGGSGVAAYELDTGSPGENASSTGTDIGADVSQVGSVIYVSLGTVLL